MAWRGIGVVDTPMMPELIDMTPDEQRDACEALRILLRIVPIASNAMVSDYETDEG
jgi:hypothetical protein